MKACDGSKDDFVLCHDILDGLYMIDQFLLAKKTVAKAGIAGFENDPPEKYAFGVQGECQQLVVRNQSEHLLFH